MGPILGMEVVTAFFVEAGFIGILLYGDGRVRPPTMFTAAVMVSLGTILSSTWIIANNSWMQTPSGFVVRDGRFEPVNWLHVIFSPSFLWSWYHMLGAVRWRCCCARCTSRRCARPRPPTTAGSGRRPPRRPSPGC
jgi:cytochrome d ubiquinol oxidase subunit I